MSDADLKAQNLVHVLIEAGIPKQNIAEVMNQLIDILYLENDPSSILFKAKIMGTHYNMMRSKKR